jgi:TPR repeat protein
MYQKGLGVSPDPEQALSYYRLAAGQGHKLAEDNLERYAEEFAALPPADDGHDHGEEEPALAEGLTPKPPKTAQKISNIF